jgi:hypothetical protein
MQFPADPTVNGSVTVTTTGILSSPNCDLPSSFTLTPTNGNYAISAKSVGQCSVNFTINPSSADQQNGVLNVPGCNGVTDPDFDPVMFWFFYLSSNNQPQATGVFCQPTILPYNILTTADLNNGSLTNVTVFHDYVTPNNVTGPPLSGVAFNAYVNLDISGDRFIDSHIIIQSLF